MSAAAVASGATRRAALAPRRGAALALLSLGLAAACGDAEPPPTELIADLARPGPHAVGYRSVSIGYDAPLTGARRTTEVLVWYPAQAVRGDRPLYLLKVSEVAVIDAPPLALGVLPVVVFSHGHQAYASAMSFLMEHLASHGFLVIAPMHTGNTFADGDDRQTDIYYLRAHDLRAALDELGGGGPAVVAGHSFGGYTALAAAGARFDVDALVPACAAGTGPAGFCSALGSAEADLFRAGLADARYRGVLALDSGDFDLFGAAGVAAVAVPALHVVAEESVAAGDRYWSALASPRRTRVLLRGGAHNDFTDSCGAGAGIRCSALPPAEVLRMVRVVGLAFARSVLLGDAAVETVLRGEVEVSTLAEITAPQ